MSVCFEIDNWLIDEDKTMWIVTLSDGSVVYQDDNRPGLDEPSAWLRLKKYVYDNDLNVTGMKIKFRSHTEDIIPIGEYDGLFFKRGLLAFVFSGKTNQKYVVGFIRGGIINVQHWKIPEITFDEDDLRKLENEDRKCVILNTRLRSMEEKLVPNNI